MSGRNRSTALDPERYAGLDPDGDGIACPELPCGAAPAPVASYQERSYTFVTVKQMLQP